jgi:hypothetical protein
VGKVSFLAEAVEPQISLKILIFFEEFGILFVWFANRALVFFPMIQQKWWLKLLVWVD